jgi:hypothetical protein
MTSHTATHNIGFANPGGGGLVRGRGSSQAIYAIPRTRRHWSNAPATRSVLTLTGVMSRHRRRSFGRSISSPR